MYFSIVSKMGLLKCPLCEASNDFGRSLFDCSAFRALPSINLDLVEIESCWQGRYLNDPPSCLRRCQHRGFSLPCTLQCFKHMGDLVGHTSHLHVHLNLKGSCSCPLSENSNFWKIVVRIAMVNFLRDDRGEVLKFRNVGISPHAPLSMSLTSPSE